MAFHHRYATVGEHQLFYREAGPADARTVVLLRGFPTSSFMFRARIPKLADRYHVIAPDHLGFGLSDAPSADDFDYSFDALADLTEGLLGQLGVGRYAMYVQDYGAPVGWRLALAHPESISAIISQNGNGYEAGFAQAFWKPVREFWDDPSPQTEAAVRQAPTLEAIKWQYLHGVPDPSGSARTPGITTTRWSLGPAMTWSRCGCSPTTPAVSRCTRSCTLSFVPAGCRSWRCGAERRDLRSRGRARLCRRRP